MEITNEIKSTVLHFVIGILLAFTSVRLGRNTAIVVAALGVLYIYLAKAIKEYKMWAKVVQIIFAVLGLFSFPIGTVIGIFVLWVLLINKETKNLFH